MAQTETIHKITEMNLLEHDERRASYRSDFDIDTIASSQPTMKSTVFPEDSPEPAEQIALGLCITCDNLGGCVWQHNNKINCQHFQ